MHPSSSHPLLLRCRRLFRWHACCSLACALLGGLTPPAAAEQDRAPAEAVMAGFVYNFAKFAEWPGSGPESTQPLRICALGARPLGGQLARLQDRSIQQRRVVVQTRVPAAEWTACQVLFIGADEGRQLEAVLHSLGQAPVLTVSDLPGFIQAGGMIGMKEVDNRIRFEVNLVAAQRAELRLSSQMLRLATQVLQ